MALPENQVIAAQGPGRRPVCYGLPAPGKLHVAVARQRDAAGFEGRPGQPGAVKAEALAPAPEIRRMQKTRGRRSGIIFCLIKRRSMTGCDPPAARCPKEAILLARHRKTASHGDQPMRRGFQVRLRIYIGAQRRDAMRRHRHLIAQPGHPSPADIAVAVQLNEGEVPLFPDQADGFAVKGLRHHLSVSHRGIAE